MFSASQKLRAFWTRSHPLPPFVLIISSVSVSSFSSLPLSFLAKYPTNRSGEAKQLSLRGQGRQEYQCNIALRCSKSKRAPVGGPHAREKLGKSTMAEHVFFDNSKLMIFSSILRTWFPWTYVKKKTRDSSGCFIS